MPAAPPSPEAPLILSFDTSGPWCAAALVRGGETLARRVEPLARGQAERLVAFLEDILAAAGTGWPDLAAVACGTGPGNSTGTRVSVAAARALALALRIPGIGVTRFEAEAEGLPRPCLVALDGGHGEIWAERSGKGAFGPSVLNDATAARAGAASVVRAATLSGPDTDRPTLPPEALAERIGHIAAARLGRDNPRPAPVYLRAPGAAPPRDAPPAILP